MTESKHTRSIVTDAQVEAAQKAIYEHKPYLNDSGKSHMAWSVYKRDISDEYERVKVAVRIGLEAAASLTRLPECIRNGDLEAWIFSHPERDESMEQARLELYTFRAALNGGSDAP